MSWRFLIALTGLLTCSLLIPTSDVEAQYIDENTELQWLTDADYVTYRKPKWIGPYRWIWLPPTRDWEIFPDKSLSVLDKGECTIAGESDPYADKSGLRCKPGYTKTTPVRGQAPDTVRVYRPEDAPFNYERIKDEKWGSGKNITASATGGGYGKVVFTWTWRKHTVHRKLCDSTETSALSREEIVQGDGKSERSKSDLMRNEPADVEDIDVPVRICADNPKQRENNRPQPYDSWREMQLGKKKCTLKVINRFDDGHSVGGELRSTWRRNVPPGWFQGENEGFSKPEFMDWCVNGGDNPFSPDPYPEVDKEEFQTSKVYSDDPINNDYEGAGSGAERPWAETEDKAGTFTNEQYALRECNRLYNEIINRRRAAFQELCKEETYGHFNGCSRLLKRCKGFQSSSSGSDNILSANGSSWNSGNDVGVGECCTDTHLEYHYHEVRSFKVPCKPIDAFVWSSRGVLMDNWVDPQGGDAKDGGVAGRVAQVEDRGFVDSNGSLSVVGGDGKAMKIRASRGYKVGTYFWFDLLSGNIGMRSFDRPKVRQKVTLPTTHKEAEDTPTWKWGNNIRGSDGGLFDTPDPISEQRSWAEGWLYQLYFCERTFTEEQMKLVQQKWDSLPSELRQAKNEICPEGDSYVWNSRAQEFVCENETPPAKRWCASCITTVGSNSCRSSQYADWRVVERGEEYEGFIVHQSKPSANTNSQASTNTTLASASTNDGPWSTPQSRGASMSLDTGMGDAKFTTNNIRGPGDGGPGRDPGNCVDCPGDGGPGRNPGIGGGDPGGGDGGNDDPGNGGQDPGNGGQDPGNGGQNPGGGQDPGNGGQDPGNGGQDPGRDPCPGEEENGPGTGGPGDNTTPVDCPGNDPPDIPERVCKDLNGDGQDVCYFPNEEYRLLYCKVQPYKPQGTGWPLR